MTAQDLIETHDLDLADSARLLAMMNLTAADASINCWNDKYHFDFWRPWNAIARAGEDGNPATDPEAGWTPLRSAPYPDHPSGHMCLDGAHLGALEHFFATDEVALDVTSFVVRGEASSTVCRSRWTRSKTPGSGQVCTIAPRTSKAGSSARTSPTT